MHPIYLASITVGSKFHPGHMKRALYERITDHVGPLPSDNYKFNRPQMYATTSPETRQATKVRFKPKKNAYRILFSFKVHTGTFSKISVSQRLRMDLGKKS